MKRLRAVIVVGLGLTVTSPCLAAGLYFSDRGVRPLGRGSAFVAGADDINATWYNPAGLADAGTSVLVDFAWLNFTSEFTRRTLVRDSVNGAERIYTSPTVKGSTPFLPLPTLGASYEILRNQLTAAFSIHAPYTAVASYPTTVRDPSTGKDEPSSSRYLLISMDGSALVVPGLYLAYKPVEEFRIGAGVSAVMGSFVSTLDFSAVPPDRLLSTPEDPKFDARTKLKAGPIFAPSASAGMVYTPVKEIRLGVSGQLPTTIDSKATNDVTLPQTPDFFANASQDGNRARVRFKLPAILRAGIETRPMEDLRVELSYVVEFWSAHDTISIMPEDLKIRNVTGLPDPLYVAPISIARKFRDTHSVRLGGEYAVVGGPAPIVVRAGVNYEKSAIPGAYLSPLTIDLDKLIGSVGASMHIARNWRFDLTVAHVFTWSKKVAPEEARVNRVNPLIGNPVQTEAVNGGEYQARANVFGIGLNYRFR